MTEIRSLGRKLLHLAEMIKFSHSIFALPFALSSMLVAAHGLPSFWLLLFILCAMVTARNSGMAFNRFLDADIDSRNPRTQSRHIPQGIISKKFALTFSLVNAGLFIIITTRINTLAFLLSIPALCIVALYSATKRWTHWSHLVLGLVLGISPVGAWIAVKGDIELPSMILAVAVIFWVAGFDIIYATQDHAFDQKEGLHSLVVRMGIPKALNISRLFHILTMIALAAFGSSAHLGRAYYVMLGVVALLFVYEHSLVKPTDLSRVNAAFFNINGIISLLFLGGVALSLE